LLLFAAALPVGGLLVICALFDFFEDPFLGANALESLEKLLRGLAGTDGYFNHSLKPPRIEPSNETEPRSDNETAPAFLP
jgi:hypothetical protein